MRRALYAKSIFILRLAAVFADRPVRKASHLISRIPNADEDGISFAENSRKPPFSLGLQSFLELLLHKIGVPRVSHSVHETDALSQKQLDKTNVHGMHAVRSADLN